MGKILLVYPSDHEELHAIPQEVATVANVLGNVILCPLLYDEGKIGTEIDLVLGANSTISGLWFAGHADGESVILGAVKLDIWAIIQYVQTSGAEWVFFNVCHGDRLTKLLQMATGVTTIAVESTANETGKIEDEEAWRMSTSFARSLKKNDYDVRAAFQEISPRGASKYIFREGFRGTVVPSTIQPGTGQGSGVETEPQAPNFVALHAIDVRLTILETQLKFQTEAILLEIAELKKEIAELKRAQNTPPIVSQAFDRSTWTMLVASMMVSGLFFAGLTIMIYTLGR